VIEFVDDDGSFDSSEFSFCCGFYRENIKNEKTKLKRTEAKNQPKNTHQKK
jgi:hypothetical protein